MIHAHAVGRSVASGGGFPHTPEVTSPKALAAADNAVFISPDGDVTVDVRLGEETVWLTTKQMAEVFQTTTQNITTHLRRIFQEGEVSPTATCKRYLQVQAEGSRRVTRQLDHYSLDAILSVGYRINSKRGTQFRIWATTTLCKHLVDGFTLNTARLEQRGIDELQNTIGLLSETLQRQNLLTDEGKAVLDIVTGYARSWRLLLEYDEERLSPFPGKAVKQSAPFTTVDARTAIIALKDDLQRRHDATDIFGAERTPHGLTGIIEGLEQTWDAEPLYPTAQSRAAHLLYFIIKDHPFVDGNKRIGCLLFLDYLRRQRLLGRGGHLTIQDTTLVALALLIAESPPRHKDMMIRLTVNLLAEF